MYGGQVMVVLIVAIVMVATIIKTMIRGRGQRLADDPEAQRLRDEVKALKERLAVLERITVEKENSLAREIEQLRDR